MMIEGPAIVHYMEIVEEHSHVMMIEGPTVVHFIEIVEERLTVEQYCGSLCWARLRLVVHFPMSLPRFHRWY